MRGTNWWLIQTMPGDDHPFPVFQWNGKGWQYRFSLATEAEVQQFIEREDLMLRKTDTTVQWPTQMYKARTHKCRKSFPSRRHGKPIRSLPSSSSEPEA